ncbi:uncharacterized protein LOC131941569 [Physella acuta]|uniref:uncharacterized protein LOC131941569 n=1 Tax=Physella acuta TaxID=109671 RepID=UPI0027DE221C|nr:uncharacterized protein LOC131941569 [Physella acuta]
MKLLTDPDPKPLQTLIELVHWTDDDDVQFSTPPSWGNEPRVLVPDVPANIPVWLKDGDYCKRRNRTVSRNKTDFHKDYFKNRNKNRDNDADSDDDDCLSKKTIDNFLLAWHTSLLLLSFFLLIVGVVLRFHFTSIVISSVQKLDSYEDYRQFVRFESAPRELVFGDIVQMLGNSLIILNGVYIMCTVLYMSYLMHKNPFTLPLVALVSGFVVLIEVNIINIYMAPFSHINEESKRTLKDKISHVYAIDDSTVFSVTYDIISIWGQCCGIIDQYDYQTLTLRYIQRDANSVVRQLQVPPTCCKSEVVKEGLRKVHECAEASEGIYTEGCYMVLYNWLLPYTNGYSLMVIVQLIDITIHLMLYKKSIKQTQEEHSIVIERPPEEDE